MVSEWARTVGTELVAEQPRQPQMGKGRGDDPLPVILFFVGICVIGAISADIYALKSIWTIWSQRWVQNPGGCVVHGMWTEQHWRRVSCGRHSTCNEDFWQYHFEVSVVGKNWPRGEACYYASCANTEYDDADHACCERLTRKVPRAPAPDHGLGHRVAERPRGWRVLGRRVPV